MEANLMRTKFLYGWDALRVLQEAGYSGAGIQRVVIDIKHDDYAVMYVQKALDTDVLDVIIESPTALTRGQILVKAVD
jgi:hypothetical protein